MPVHYSVFRCSTACRRACQAAGSARYCTNKICFAVSPVEGLVALSRGRCCMCLSLGKCVPSTCKLPDADSHLLIAATMQALARTTIAPQRLQQHACRALVPSRLYSRSRASLMIHRAQPTVSAPFISCHEPNHIYDRRIAEQEGVEALLMCFSSMRWHDDRGVHSQLKLCSSSSSRCGISIAWLSPVQETEAVTKEQKTKEEQVLPLSCTCLETTRCALVLCE